MYSATRHNHLNSSECGFVHQIRRCGAICRFREQLQLYSKLHNKWYNLSDKIFLRHLNGPCNMLSIDTNDHLSEFQIHFSPCNKLVPGLKFLSIIEIVECQQEKCSGALICYLADTISTQLGIFDLNRDLIQNSKIRGSYPVYRRVNRFEIINKLTKILLRGVYKL